MRAIEAINDKRLVALWSPTHDPTKAAWLATSVDGGSTWRAVGTSLPVPLQAYPAPAVAFTSSRRGAVLDGGKVLTTANGGATWRRAVLPGRPFSLSIAGGVAWASSLVCHGGSRRDGCSVTVATDDFGGGGGWGTATARLPVGARPTPIVAQSGASTGLLYPSPDDPSLPADVTEDRGHHWRAAGAPCAASTPVPVGHGRTIEQRWVSVAALAATNGGSPDLWAVCLGGAAAGTETKGVEVSSDDGGTWSQIAAFPSIVPDRDPSGLPAGDFVALLARPGGKLVMATPNYLATSTDRGASWQGVPGINLGGVAAMMTSDRRGTVWVLAPTLGLWRWSVGGRWRALDAAKREKALTRR